MPSRLICVNKEFNHYFIEDYDDDFQPLPPKKKFSYLKYLIKIFTTNK